MFRRSDGYSIWSKAYIFALLTFKTYFAVGSPSTSQQLTRATLNRDIRYDVWSNPQRILYRLDTNYNQSDMLSIKNAMDQISADMSQCVRFMPYNIVTDSREDHIFISPLLNSGAPAVTCTTFPGRLVRQNGQGQKMMILSGAGGCLGSKRDVMSILVPVLGLRSEYKRPDRDDFLRTFPANIMNEFQSLNLLKLYNKSQVQYQHSDFDFKSITIPSPTRFARPNTAIYTPRNASISLGSLARLSLGDCAALKRLYPTCETSACNDPYANITDINASTVKATESINPENGTSNGLSLVITDAITLAVSNALQQAMQTAAANGGRPVFATSRFTSPTTTATTSTTTRPVPMLDVPAEPQPIDPPFGGVEFFLNPKAKEEPN